MKVRDRAAGDRVRLADDRVFELAFAMYPREGHADAVIRPAKTTTPSGFFARQIVENVFGDEVRSELEWLHADLAVVELVREMSSRAAGDDRGQRGGDIDPLLGRARGDLL